MGGRRSIGTTTAPLALWVRAFGLAHLGVAVDQGRDFTAIVFSGPGTIVVHDFQPAEFTTAKMLPYASVSTSGGTDFTGPLDLAVARLQAEFDTTGRVSGDVVFATDGDADVPAGWLDGFHDTQDRLGFNVYGLGIGPEATSSTTLHGVCRGNVVSVRSLADGADVCDIFRSLNRTSKEAVNV